jgi:hypothetical protein
LLLNQLGYDANNNIFHIKNAPSSTTNGSTLVRGPSSATSNTSAMLSEYNALTNICYRTGPN